MSFWTVDNLSTVVRGVKLARLPESAGDPVGVGTDTRTLSPGQAFIALRGERFDGHDLLEQALEAGSTLVVVDRPDGVVERVAGRAAVISVDDTLGALQQMAKAYRQRLTGRVIAITGSAGKTTTKALVDAVLRPKFHGTVSPKSFNNHIGVPLTLLAADPTDEYVICEVGTNAPGEIATLGRICQPDIAVITTVGRSHLEGLGGVDGVLREKASLIGQLRDGGIAIVNGDVPGLEQYRKVTRSFVTFGRGAGCDLRLTKYANEPDNLGGTFEVNGRWQYRVPLLGEHNAVNSLAAIAVGMHMQLSEIEIAGGLAQAEAPDMRLRIETIGQDDRTVTVINDAYNANPESMAAALAVLAAQPTTGRRVAVLGDMMELGDAAPDLHRELGDAVVASGIDRVHFVGPLCLFAAETALRHWPDERVHAHAEFNEDTPGAIADSIKPGDTVLVKASRTGGLERVVAAITDRLGSEPR